MANELVHKSAGTVLEQAEDDAVDRHKFNNQAIGDIMYASSTSQLSRLAIGTDNYFLRVATNIPVWESGATVLADISPLTTRGDMMFRNATVSTRLVKGADNTILAMGADDPEWKTPATILGDLTGANLDVGAYDVRGATLTADGLTSGRVVFAGASGVLSDDDDFTFSVDTLTVTKIAGTEFTGAVTGISLSEIENLEADKTFTMTSKNLTYNFTTPSQGITLNVTGAFSDHLFHIHQTTGNPGVGSELIHLQTEDSDVIPLHIEHSGNNASFEALEFELHRSSPTDGDNIVFGWHFWHDGAATSTAQIELARIKVTATDVSENTEDASFTFSVMKAGSMTDLVTITSTVITLAGTLAGVTALDATTESTIEVAIDTLANLTSIQGHTVTLTGNLVMSGAYNLTLTIGANTNVTFPASGTLATLVGTEELTNKTLDSSVLKGTFTNSGTVTLPAFKLGGDVTANSKSILGVSAISGRTDAEFHIYSAAADNYLLLDSRRTAANAGAAIIFRTYNVGDGEMVRLSISGGLNEAIATWSNITQEGLKLGNALTLNGYAFDAGSGEAQINTIGGGVGLLIKSTGDGAYGSTLTLEHATGSLAVNDKVAQLIIFGVDGASARYQWAYERWVTTNIGDGTEAIRKEWALTVAGSSNVAMTLSGAGEVWADLGFDADEYYKVAGTQVVGARVVDARCDDTVNTSSWDSETAGVLDALRDAMITHGLVAAS